MNQKYSHLNITERNQIYLLLAEGRSGRQIAQVLGRSHATISREIQRNKHPELNSYVPDSAQNLAQSRRIQVGSKIERSKDLQRLIEDYLAMNWSPEVIAGRLKQELGKQIISHESIYKWIYGSGKHRNLPDYLARKKRKRGRRPCRKVDKIRIPNRTSIHSRPESCQKDFGNWEGDTVHFSGRQGAILTLYEKNSKLLLGAKMQTRRSDETIDYMKLIFESLPEKARQSVTFDNGLEFAEHQQLKANLGIQTYFCDTYSSWQKGGVENANGILRRRIPKKTRSEEITEKQVQEHIHRINLTPRKSLGYRTPYESFFTNLDKNTKMLNLISSSVALQN